MHHVRRSSCLPGLVLLGLALVPAPALAQAPVADLVDAARPATVHVQVLFSRSGKTAAQSRGGDTVRVERPSSGVLLDPAGRVLTNAHLVAEVPDGEPSASAEFWLRVKLADGRGFEAVVLGRDERLDLAVLQLRLEEGARVPALPLAASGDAELGGRVVGIGDPHGEQVFAFAGALAPAGGPLTLREAQLQPEELWRTDARFHDVLDGGPLLDDRGQVIGLHNASHIGVHRPGFDDDEPEEGEEAESLDYAVIVSAAAVREAVGRWLPGEESPPEADANRAADPMVEAIEALAPSVLGVWTGPRADFPSAAELSDPQGQRLPDGLGSGVIVHSSGLVLCASELFEDAASSAWVRLASGEVIEARVRKRSAPSGAVLLQLELEEGRRLPAAPLASSSQAQAGERVAVIGRPQGGAPSLSVGVLSAPERGRFIQLASWVHRGHRGAALADVRGRLLGIAVRPPRESRGASEQSYLGFAAAIDRLREEFAEVWEAEETSATSDASRQTAVTGIVEATRGSLVNVIVSRAVETKKSGGFNPFASAKKTFRPLGLGSGVIIDETGLALSNWHVVDAAMDPGGGQSEDAQVRVTLPDGREYEARVLSTSRDDDLALLALQLAPGETLRPVELGDSAALRIGELVVAIGNPHGLSNSVSAGIVSSKEHAAMIQGRARMYRGMLVTDAAINPGNSGGALLDGQGRLVGINSAGSVGWGLAIPVDKAREVFSEKLLSVEKLRSSYLGMAVVEDGAHVVVDEVDPGGPAAKAGVEIGDNLLRVGDRDVVSAVEFARIQLAARAGAALRITLEREGERRTLGLVPMSYAAWRILQQTGIELVEVDASGEAARVRAAGVALYRAYTGNAQGQPREAMAGALRVVSVESRPGEGDLDLLPGDLLLGLSVRSERIDLDSDQLARVESIQALRAVLDPLATREGSECTAWLLRDGGIVTTRIRVQRPR